MKTEFAFDSEQYDYWPLYETIKQYYPLGIKASSVGNHLYDEYPGQKAIQDMMHEQVAVQKNYREGWGKLKNFLKAEIKKPVQSTISLFAPCLSGLVLLKHVKESDYIKRKELHFAISLLGPYYTLFGMDTTTLLLEGEPKDRELFEGEDSRQYFQAVHAVTVSPIQEYKPAFELLQTKLLEWYKAYKFVPYQINVMQLEGLHIGYSSFGDTTEGTIYKALFNNLLDTEVMVRGDSYYGEKDWVNNQHHS